jgi:hypothetical protein
VPRRGTRAYLVQTLKAHVRRAFRAAQRWPHDTAQIKTLLATLPAGTKLLVYRDDTVDLDFTDIETEAIAKAVACIGPVRRGRPKGSRRPIDLREALAELLAEIAVNVRSGLGSVRSESERLAQRTGLSAERLRKLYRRYVHER